MLKSLFCRKTPSTRKIEESVTVGVMKFLVASQLFSGYVRTIGIQGPCARGEGLYVSEYVRSDVDFFVVTSSINPLKERKLRRLFEQCFDKECSLLVYSPTIFKRPDLMFFEATRGKHLGGERLSPVPIQRISKFEGFRNLIYRGAFFLEADSRGASAEELAYAYSKVVFAAGEVCLLLEGDYCAGLKERNRRVKKSPLARELGIVKEHEKMQNFRETGKVPSVDTSAAYGILRKSMDLMIERIADGDIRNLSRLHPNWASSLVNKVLFFFRTGKVHLVKEPFIRSIENFYSCVNGHGDLQDVLLYWKNAPWFLPR